MAHQTSLAFDGVGGRWEWYKEGGANVPMGEIHEHLATLTVRKGPPAATDLKAMIRTKLKTAERGALHEPGNGCSNLVSARGVMEIKWSQGRDQWRLYYCEPLHLDRVMLGLLFNQKHDNDQQDRDIDEAAHRWTCWQAGLAR